MRSSHSAYNTCSVLLSIYSFQEIFGHFLVLQVLPSIFKSFSHPLTYFGMCFEALYLIRRVSHDRRTAGHFRPSQPETSSSSKASTGTVTTVVTCKMGSDGTRLYYGPFEGLQTLLFVHLSFGCLDNYNR